MINWDRVAELRDEVGEEDFGEVVELFLEEVEGTLDKLRTAPEIEKLEDDLHFLKGGALNLGFDEFGQLCMIGERAAADGKAAGIDLAQILKSYAVSKAAFMARAADFGLAA
ncbi:MAG: Hpt domain-containing protein [Pseudomonadota bacterium]